MKPTSYLYVITNRSDAQFLRRSGLIDEFEPILHLTNPEGRRIPGSEFSADKPGTVYSASPSHANAYSPRTSVTEAQEEAFSRVIARQIAQLNNSNEFDNLVIVAEPGMLGALKAVLDKSCAKKLTQTISKDIASLGEREVSARLSELL